MIGDIKILVIGGRVCNLVEGEFGFDVDEWDAKYAYKKWVVCTICGMDKFELSHGDHQLISRCSNCYHTETEYDG